MSFQNDHTVTERKKKCWETVEEWLVCKNVRKNKEREIERKDERGRKKKLGGGTEKGKREMYVDESNKVREK